MWYQWKSVDVINISLLISSWNNLIGTAIREGVSIINCTFVDKSPENGFDKSDIFVICDSTTIINLGSECVKYFEINLIIVIKETLKLLSAHIKIFEGECIWNIPANGSELSSVLYDSMEEREREHEFLEFIWLSAVVKCSVIQIGVSSKKVRF